MSSDSDSSVHSVNLRCTVSSNSDSIQSVNIQCTVSLNSDSVHSTGKSQASWSKNCRNIKEILKWNLPEKNCCDFTDLVLRKCHLQGLIQGVDGVASHPP